MGSTDATLTIYPVEDGYFHAPYIGIGLKQFKKRCWCAQASSWACFIQRVHSSTDGYMKLKAQYELVPFNLYGTLHNSFQ